MFTVGALVAGDVDTGWMFHTPFSTMFSNTHVFAAVAGVLFWFYSHPAVYVMILPAMGVASETPIGDRPVGRCRSKFRN